MSNDVSQADKVSFFDRKLTLSHFVTSSSLGRILLLLLVVGAVAGAAFLASGKADSESAQKPVTLLPVKVKPLQQVSSYSELRVFTGVLKARRASELTFDRTDRLVQLLVDEGDYVKEGSSLARLDARTLLTREKELLAQRDEAKAVLAELIAGPRKEKIAVARADVKDVEAQSERAELEYRRQINLRGTTAGTQEAFDNAKHQYASMKARLEAAKRRLEELEVGTRKEKIDAQKAVVARLDAMLETLQVDIEDSTLQAPFTGRISARHVDEGVIVSPSHAIFRLVEDQHLEAHVGVPSHLTTELASEKNSYVKINGRLAEATVRTVMPELNQQTRTRTVILTLASPLPSFAPGQIARLELEETRKLHGFWVPTSALSRGTRGLWSVYVVVQRKGKAHQVIEQRDVEILHVQSDRNLVRGTLIEGDQLVIDGAHRVVPGQKVKAVVSQN